MSLATIFAALRCFFYRETRFWLTLVAFRLNFRAVAVAVVARCRLRSASTLILLGLFDFMLMGAGNGSARWGRGAVASSQARGRGRSWRVCVGGCEFSDARTRLFPSVSNSANAVRLPRRSDAVVVGAYA